MSYFIILTFILLGVCNNVEAERRQCDLRTCMNFFSEMNLASVKDLVGHYRGSTGVSGLSWNETEIRKNVAEVRKTCNALTSFDQCVGGNWYECFDIKRAIETFKHISRKQGGPSGLDLGSLIDDHATEERITKGLQFITGVCTKFEYKDIYGYMNCLRNMSSNATTEIKSVYAKFKKLNLTKCGSYRCDFLDDFLHVITYLSATNCGPEAGELTLWMAQQLLISTREAHPSTAECDATSKSMLDYVGTVPHDSFSYSDVSICETMKKENVPPTEEITSIFKEEVKLVQPDSDAQSSVSKLSVTCSAIIFFALTFLM